MEIKPLKKVKGVRGAQIETGDPLAVLPIPPEKSQQQASKFELIQNKLLYDGKEISQLIREMNQTAPQGLSALAAELEAYKEDCLRRRRERRFLFLKKRQFSQEELGIIYSLCDAYIARISELIKQRYDQTKDGMSLFFDEQGQLVVNGMNVHAYVQECRQNANPKSLIFLKGIRQRLEHAMHNRVDSRNYERLQEVILKLFDEIDEILG